VRPRPRPLSGQETALTANAIVAIGIRLVAGVIFVSFGIGKFTDHASEVTSFIHYGIPLAGASVWAVGLVETIGGLALVLGVFTRWAAAALAADMIGVVVTAGRVDGGLLNLGLAPLLLVGMLVVLWTGPGALSLDAVIARSRSGSLNI
jgi:putative oxidoreductase